MDIVIRLAADIAAVNSAGMVNKIRFVAVALLDILSEADPERLQGWTIRRRRTRDGKRP